MQWFKHDSNANTDDKLQQVLLDYGLEGYGLYWYCLELIVNRVDKDNITFELKHDARVIARNTGSTPQKVEEMMRRFIELGLFEADNGMITCLKLIKRMDSSMTSNQYMREIIAKAKQSHDGIMTQSANVMQDKNRIDENRKEKKNIVGSRLPSDWQPTKEYLDFCINERPDLDAGQIALQFKDYWIALSGSRAVKTDWFATWRNWVRRQEVGKSKHKNKSAIISDGQFDDWLNGRQNERLA